MPFTFKLSVRLALMKASLALACGGVFAACDFPGRRVNDPTSPNSAVVQVVTSPDSIILDPLQTRQFLTFGRTQAGDSVAVAVRWSTTGGAITSGGLYTADTTAGSFAVTATVLNSTVSGSSQVKNRGPVTQVVLTPATVSVAAGGSVQFAAYGIRKSGDSVGVTVSFSATGGTISAAGLYTAAATLGSYQAIA